VYFPSGSSGEERQAAKFRFLAAFLPHLQALVSEPGREVILCGDVNIAHKEIDLKNWKSNQKNSGFLPEERAWLSGLLATGWVDVFRTLNQQAEQYTWWSNRGQAYAKNVGWRIDYHLATPGIAARAQREHIYTTERFSDSATNCRSKRKQAPRIGVRCHQRVFGCFGVSGQLGNADTGFGLSAVAKTQAFGQALP
jgi:exodeoxyribonuclease III